MATSTSCGPSAATRKGKAADPLNTFARLYLIGANGIAIVWLITGHATTYRDVTPSSSPTADGEIASGSLAAAVSLVVWLFTAGYTALLTIVGLLGIAAGVTSNADLTKLFLLLSLGVLFEVVGWPTTSLGAILFVLSLIGSAFVCRHGGRV
jgi:hypothetical protein